MSRLAGRTGSVVGTKRVPPPFGLERNERNFCLGPIAQFCEGIRDFTMRFPSTCADASGLEGDSDGWYAVVGHRRTLRVCRPGTYDTQCEDHDRPLPQCMAIRLQIDSRHRDSACL